LIPFEALRDEQGRYLIERHAVSYLTSGRDLLRLQVPRESKSAPLVLADPAFDEEKGPALPASHAAAKPALVAARRSITVGRELADVYFAPLAGTAHEARVIHALFPEATVLTGVRASKSALKSATAPGLLHVATHGFFLERATNANPLLRSGLALAGANRPDRSESGGILSALEAAGLNLWGTKLVTLSACDTGIGEVKNGEGVYGLRRALVLAGAETLVMSLWPVSDYQTRELMRQYYRGLRQGRGRGDALRHVQLDMLREGKRRHPFYWASFIQSGEWANLEGRR
jgi:CHAT domain-containing protein